jgi:hypothetical protein
MHFSINIFKTAGLGGSVRLLDNQDPLSLGAYEVPGVVYAVKSSTKAELLNRKMDAPAHMNKRLTPPPPV